MSRSGQSTREPTLVSSSQQQQMNASRRRVSKPPSSNMDARYSDRNAPLAVAVAVPSHQSPFEKLNTLNTTEERERNTPQAFSHFSFVASDFRLMIVDIQGVADSYTDPQIHSADGRGFGVGNLGTFGMEKFLESHRCNEVCRWLGLRSINEQYKPGGTAAPGYEMPFGGAIKKSTNRITEERNTFSTSVTVSEAFGDTATADWTEREDSRLESGEEDEEDEEDDEDPGEHSDSTS
ncbi:hypothetical protein JG688_00016704, partial [Phytophthora aleatoria]